MTVRKLIFWPHLIAGSIAGIVIFLMSVTGILLAYQRQIVSWADRGSRVPQADQAAKPLPVEDLVQRYLNSGNKQPTTITLRSDAAAPAEFAYGRERVVFVNPYNGAVTGEGSKRVREIFSSITAWHRWLGAQTTGRALGRGITGFCNLLFLGLVCSGFFLWWPRRWSWQHLRPIIFPRRGLKGRTRNWNWHNAVGFWCAIPLFFIVLSGVVMSYSWANNLVYQLTGSPVPQQNGPERPGGRPDGAMPSNTASSLAGLDALLGQAQAGAPNWKSISFALPRSPKAPVNFSIDEGTSGRPDLRSQALAQRDGSLHWTRFSDNTTGRRVRTWLRFIHTGEAGGIPGETVALLASAGGALLVWTGLALALHRFRNWRNRKSAARSREVPIAS
jgi:uncharacterized iron-regulated membrane protein